MEKFKLALKEFFKPNKLTTILFALFIILAFTPGVGYWKSKDKIIFNPGGNFCALHPEEESCNLKFSYWKLNKFLWPINLISLVTSQNRVIYAEEKAKNYNLPTTTKNMEFPVVYLSTYIKELGISINEFNYVNKFESLTIHILPKILKLPSLIIYWYLVACLFGFLLTKFQSCYKNYLANYFD